MGGGHGRRSRCGVLYKCLSHVTIEPALALFMLASFYSYPAQQSLVLYKLCTEQATQAACLQLISGSEESGGSHANLTNGSIGWSDSFGWNDANELSVYKKVDHREEGEFAGNIYSGGVVSELEHKTLVSNASETTPQPSNRPNLPGVFSLGRPLSSNLSQSDREDLSAKASVWMFYNSLVMTLPAAVSALFLGHWCDSNSRKLPFLVSVGGQLLSTLLFLLFASTPELLGTSTYWLFIPSAVSGLGGGYTIAIMSSYSYIARRASDHKTIRITALEVVSALGSAVGSFTSGLIFNRKAGAQTAFMVGFGSVAAVYTVVFVYVVVRINDHVDTTQTHGDDGVNDSDNGARTVLVQARERPGCGGRLLSPSDVRELWCTLSSHGRVRRMYDKGTIWFILATVFLNFIPFFSNMDLLYFYAKAKHVPLDAYGYYNGYASLTAFSGTLIIVLALKLRWHWRETSLGILGVISRGVAALMLAVGGLRSVNDLSFTVLWWAQPVVASLGPLVAANLRRMASSLVGQEEQGKIFCALASGESLAQLAASALYNFWVWPATERIWPGAGFAVSALVCVGIVGFLIIIRIRLKRADAAVRDDTHEPFSYTDLSAVQDVVNER